MVNINESKGKAEFDRSSNASRNGTQYPDDAKSFKSAYSPVSPSFPLPFQYADPPIDQEQGTFHYQIGNRTPSSISDGRPKYQQNETHPKTNLLPQTNQRTLPQKSMENFTCCYCRHCIPANSTSLRSTPYAWSGLIRSPTTYGSYWYPPTYTRTKPTLREIFLKKYALIKKKLKV